MSGPFILIGPDGAPYASRTPGALGGHRRTRIYGRLDCPGARRAIARGGYVKNRVFFRDERDAIGRRISPLRRLHARRPSGLARARAAPRAGLT